MALGIGVLIYSCSKESDSSQVNELNGNNVNIAEELNNVFNKVRANNSSSRLMVQVENEENPFDNVGASHNEILGHLMAQEYTDSTICNAISEVEREFNTEIEFNCQEMLSFINEGKNETFDSINNYKTDLFDELYNSNKIGLSEYSIVNTTIENVYSSIDLNEQIELLKVAEEYTISSQSLTEVEKGRILRTFAIYRYSSFYWEIEASDKKHPIVALADALAEYWAMYGDDSPSEDGYTINAISSLVSASVSVIVTVIMP